MAKNMFFVVTIDGRAHEFVFTTVRGLSRALPEVPYSSVRVAMKAGSEYIHVHSSKVYRISKAVISRIKGRGSHLNK